MPTSNQRKGAGSTDGPAHGDGDALEQLTQQHYSPNGMPGLTTAIVYAIADAKGVDPIDMKSPPLYEIVDVPSIEKAFFAERNGNGTRHSTGSVEFWYAEYLVKVRSDGWIQVYLSHSGV